MSEEAVRLDKWLWFARFFKSRSLATRLCNAGKLRLDGNLVQKAHAKLKVGDVLTFPQGQHIRVIKVLALGNRRGPAEEARGLYEDLKPPEPANRLPQGTTPMAQALRPAGSGRPTKKQRREVERLKAVFTAND